jgi:hypothetical protein
MPDCERRLVLFGKVHLKHFLEKIAKAKADYLESDHGGGPDGRLEKMVSWSCWLKVKPQRVRVQRMTRKWGHVQVRARSLLSLISPIRTKNFRTSSSRMTCFICAC